MSKVPNRHGRLVPLLFLMLTLISFQTNAQSQKITGVVRGSEDNAVIANATVQVKGTSVGTTTDEKGSFSISGNV